jgi:hypothetical protein
MAYRVEAIAVCTALLLPLVLGGMGWEVAMMLTHRNQAAILAKARVVALIPAILGLVLVWGCGCGVGVWAEAREDGERGQNVDGNQGGFCI